ncbi:MAG: putative hydro-lyase [Anaerolineaceae bacterium]|nr:putative hydro-lyase [Anaerolineaceae bacterium]
MTIRQGRNGRREIMNGAQDGPARWRERIRAGAHSGLTAGLAPGYVQANLAVLPRALAFDFLLFCQRNPKPCPLLEVVEAGKVEPRRLAPGADWRTDLPRYRLYENGQLSLECTDVRELWREDDVAFFLGCSFTFEAALVQAGIEMRHLSCGSNVPMYITNLATEAAGQFHGPMVVSMRPIAHADVARAVQISARYPAVHGAPVHLGDPAALGICDLAQPDFGDALPIEEGETPVFWACGVTPQAVAMKAKPARMITHAPGHMFITDRRDEELATA